MNGVCDTWCTGCEFLAKSGDAYCDYYSAHNWQRRRPCRAGKGCTERVRPEKVRQDIRLVCLEARTLQEAREGQKKPKPKHGQTGRPRGGIQSAMTEAEFRARVNAQRAARSENDPQRQAEMAAIKAWRMAHGLNQRNMGKLIGVSCGTISAWEAGIAGANWAKLETLGIVRPPAS